MDSLDCDHPDTSYYIDYVDSIYPLEVGNENRSYLQEECVLACNVWLVRFINCRYELDDAEIETLLKKTMDIRGTPGLSSGHIDSETGVRCKKCRRIERQLTIGGYFNPPSATVCRDCNSLLRGNELFSSFSRKAYQVDSILFVEETMNITD